MVGGFLGAGKTTLMLAAAARLRSRGHRVAVLTNDQSGELVDSEYARAEGFAMDEVTGGCFCCRITDFLAAAERLTESPAQPDVLFAEPVGSCADLVATVMRPLQRLYSERFRIAPFTVLVDPRRAARLEDPHVAYLFRCQVAEADLVCLTKADLCDDVPDLDGVQARRISTVTGEGIDEWLAEVLQGGPAGQKLLAIDYQRYAEAEARLGWMNWSAELRASRPLSPASVAGPLLDHIDQRLTEAGAEIAHAKVFVQAETGWVKAGISENGQEPFVDGRLDASPAMRHQIVLNIRAVAAPELLESVVADAPFEGRVHVRSKEAFRPAAPQRRSGITTTISSDRVQAVMAPLGSIASPPSMMCWMRPSVSMTKVARLAIITSALSTP